MKDVNILDAEKFLSIIDTLPDGVIVVDEANMVMFVNKSAKEILSLDLERSVDKKDIKEFSGILWKFIREVSKSEKDSMIRRISFPDFRNKKVRECWENLLCENEECPLYGKNGVKCWNSCKSPKFYGGATNECEQCEYFQELPKIYLQTRGEKIIEDGKITGTIIIIRDVTKFHQVEQMKERFVSSISHELRTPVSVIRLYTSNLLRYQEQLSEEKKLEFTKVIHDQGLLLQKMVEDLLRTTKIDTKSVYKNKGLVTFSEIVQATLEDMQDTIELYGVPVKFSCGSICDDLMVRADAKNLELAVSCCLDNAIKYNQDGGEVHIKGIEVVEDGVRYKGINIVDNGWGILEKDKDKIFDSFFRSRSEEYNIPGVGLGLTIAKAIIEDHNGKIRIESEFKKGTECEIIFPVDDAKKKILIVDDEMDFHVLVNQLFEMKGYETLNAISGEQGLEILKTEVPNLILLDLMMPGMNGQEVLQKIREDSRTEKVPVVIITAEREYDPKKLKALGADDYISKPFSGDVLLDVLNRFFYKE